MAMSTWIVLGVICLLYIAFGIWAVSQIFPRTQSSTPRLNVDHMPRSWERARPQLPPLSPKKTTALPRPQIKSRDV